VRAIAAALDGFASLAMTAASRVQNKKYLCAMLKLSAGSQVSNWPSAVTA
jgi:hypothetical protein